MVVHDVLSIELLAREVDLVKEVLGELLARTVAEVALRAPRDSVGHGWGRGVHGARMARMGTWCMHASAWRAFACLLVRGVA